MKSQKLQIYANPLTFFSTGVFCKILQIDVFGTIPLNQMNFKNRHNLCLVFSFLL